MTAPVSVDQNDCATDHWQDPSRGSIGWKTLISGDVTATNALVCGIAIMATGDTFALHSHAEPELYFGLEGEVDVIIDGQSHRLGGLLPGLVTMQKKLAALGMQDVELPEGRLRGHTFHYSLAQTPLEILVRSRRANGNPGEAVYRRQRLTASYLHLYFPSDPVAAARLFLPA